jgi:hypothetical protein
MENTHLFLIDISKSSNYIWAVLHSYAMLIYVELPESITGGPEGIRKGLLRANQGCWVRTIFQYQSFIYRLQLKHILVTGYPEQKLCFLEQR